MFSYSFISNDYFSIAQIQLVAVTQIFIAIGMFCIFKKAGQKSYMAFVPFVNWIKMGELIGHDKFGVFTSFIGIFKVLLMQMSDNDPFEYSPSGMILVTVVASSLFIINIVYSLATVLMFKWLIESSGKSLIWILPFAIAPGLTMLYWGLNKNMRVEV
ncbi:hypothetical protein [Butyrivibrio sp. JL13D10]|uniref:hypothetical protein n=1 Tax=Butyrivibrio sp. JL13D10 TaxID=3236815 RepID=UPI0038B546EA